VSKAYISAELAQQVRADAGHRCGYCRASEAITSVPLTFDHIIPEAAEGPTTRENLWLACERCNRYKADRVTAPDPETGQVVPLFNSRTQIWREHFAWSEDGTHILGLTPTGRATVLALHLNHPLAVMARRLWASVGWHPPQE
jgi:hypothetical protein